MTIEQALQILDQAASRAMLPREDHYRIQVAVQTLKESFDQMQKELEEIKKAYDDKPKKAS